VGVTASRSRPRSSPVTETTAVSGALVNGVAPSQLQRLADQQVLATRRAGNSIYYRIVDACVPALLELGWCLLDTTQTPETTPPDQ
jgi:hypothetical protein